MKHFHTIYLFLLAIAAISYEGCTLIGYGIGSAIDALDGKDFIYSKPIFRDVRSDSGHIAQIQYNDSTLRLATFRGYTDESYSAYQMRMNSFVSSHSNATMLPFKIGDSIAFSDGRHHKYVVQLLDFSADSIDTRFSTNIERGPVDGWTYIGKPGGENSFEALKLALDSNAVPVRAILHFSDSEKSFTLTNSDFYNVKFIDYGNAKWIGLGIGAVIDIAEIILAIVIHNEGGFFQGFSN
jgi:hypothetical protein